MNDLFSQRLNPPLGFFFTKLYFQYFLKAFMLSNISIFFKAQDATSKAYSKTMTLKLINCNNINYRKIEELSQPVLNTKKIFQTPIKNIFYSKKIKKLRISILSSESTIKNPENSGFILWMGTLKQNFKIIGNRSIFCRLVVDTCTSQRANALHSLNCRTLLQNIENII